METPGGHGGRRRVEATSIGDCADPIPKGMSARSCPVLQAAKALCQSGYDPAGVDKARPRRDDRRPLKGRSFLGGRGLKKSLGSLLQLSLADEGGTVGLGDAARRGSLCGRIRCVWRPAWLHVRRSGAGPGRCATSPFTVEFAGDTPATPSPIRSHARYCHTNHHRSDFWRAVHR